MIKRILICTLFYLGSAALGRAQTINAVDCSPTALTNAFTQITQATSVINLPACTPLTSGNWTTKASLAVPSVNTSLSILGTTSCTGSGDPEFNNLACTDGTIIQDNDSVAGDNQFLLNISATGFLRVANLTIQKGTGITKNLALFEVQAGNNLHLDHMHFNADTGTSASDMVYIGGCTRGVADHILVTNNNGGVNEFLFYNGISCAGNPFTDDTWAAATQFGSSDFFFLEASAGIDGTIAANSQFNDCLWGGKQSIRFNSFTNAHHLQTHPTGSTNERRGCRASEVYGNAWTMTPSWLANWPYRANIFIIDTNFRLQKETVTTCVSSASNPTWSTAANGVTADGTCSWTNQGFANVPTLFFWSSGPSIWWGNQVNQPPGGAAGYSTFLALHNCRNGANGCGYPTAPTPNNYGYNGPVPIQSGTATVSGTTVTCVTGCPFSTLWPSGRAIYITGATCPNTGGAPNGPSCTISSVAVGGATLTLLNASTTTITTPAVYGAGSCWDGNTNSKGYPPIDGPTRGKSDLLTGSFPNRLDSVTSTCTWPNQQLEPLYAWLNGWKDLCCGNGPTGLTAYVNLWDSIWNNNVDYYVSSDLDSAVDCNGFTGATGIGCGPRNSRPATCTTGVAWWSTDQGSWNASGNGFGNGVLDKCTATNTWTNAVYVPFTYPHPLAGGGGGGTPVASLSPTTLAFGNVPITATSASQTVTLTNTGNATLTWSSITISTTYNISGGTCALASGTLAAGLSCTVISTFNPTALGIVSGNITVNDNASGAPHLVPVTGTGVSAIAFSASEVSFGVVLLPMTSNPAQVTVTNNGSAATTISSVTLGGTNPTDFALTTPTGVNCSTVGSLAAGASCNIAMTFTPLASGKFSATVSVADGYVDSPQSFTISGTGSQIPSPAPNILAGITILNGTVELP